MNLATDAMSKFIQTFVLVHDLRTELVVQPFADRILVLVTQMGKVGNLVCSFLAIRLGPLLTRVQIQASIPSTADLHSFDVSNPQEPFPPPPPAIQLTQIFGSAPTVHLQTLYSLYAAQIATLLWLAIGGKPHSVVMGIALQQSKDHAGEELSKEEQQTFHAVMVTLQTLLKS